MDIRPGGRSRFAGLVEWAIMEQTSQSEKLSEFIHAAREKGASDEFVTSLLRERGWPAKAIYAAFGKYYESLTGLPVPVRSQGAGEAARDGFLYLLVYSALATWTIALGSLIFTYVDKWFPDVLAQPVYQGSRYEISNDMACIIVALPIFLLVMRTILRDLNRTPEKAESGVRKWLTYIALLIAAGVVMGDLITFLAYFLRGELTTRFLLKVLTVIAIAGGVFWYYLGFLRRGSEPAES
jgi:hypothetical protein